MPVYMSAHYQVKRGSRERCLAAIREFVDAVRAGEPGTLLYVALQHQGDPDRFTHLMCFADAAAEERHRASAYVGRFVDALTALADGAVQFERFAPVAGGCALP